jgi:adenine-specific DNA methylase
MEKKIKDLNFQTVLDAFGGTGSVSHLLKRKNKQVIYNDILKFNHIIGKALIENSYTRLSDEDVDFILNNNSGTFDFVQKTFKDIFYVEEENKWLDRIIYNLEQIEDQYKRAIAYFSLFQSCIIKRPYNLFIEQICILDYQLLSAALATKRLGIKVLRVILNTLLKNQIMPFFSNGTNCISYNNDAQKLDIENVDMVYFDTPYISSKGVGTDYLDFYHFLEGIADYSNWGEKINRNYKHIPIKRDGKCPWTDKDNITAEFEKLIKKYQNSKIVISYRNDGIPSIEKLHEILSKYKDIVYEVYSRDYKYALSNSDTKEVLIIGL